MLQEETLQPTGRRQYEEPEGKFLELIESGNNTLSVLTRVESDKVGDDLPDPGEYSVAELEDELPDDLTDEQRTALVDQEEAGNNRTTAIAAINSA